MGVLHLWEVVREAKLDVRIDDIRGKTLAVDLAAWICESETVKHIKSYVVRPYLRNLFFRVTAIMKADIHVVFILDGKAPELKWQTIAKRLETSGSPRKTLGTRSRLNAKLKECCDLLDSLGLPWIKAEGEAEALCATLNSLGLVDGVITNDGDAFLYGAKTVYRNFSIEKNGIIEKYNMDDIESKLRMSRKDLIALALLLGCDYCPKGVQGVGVAQATKLLTSFDGVDPFHVFDWWRKSGECHNKTTTVKKPSHCSACGHEGLKKDHSTNGCKTCGYDCPDVYCNGKFEDQSIPCQCNWHLGENKRKKYILEEKVKACALKDPSFPNRRIVEEFMTKQMYIHSVTARTVDPAEETTSLKILFKKDSPVIDIACWYLEQKLEWKLPYALQKVLPLVTRYKICHHGTPEKNPQLELEGILKKRIKDSTPSLEVNWRILSDELIRELPEDIDCTTIESEDEMKLAFPNDVKVFYQHLEQVKCDKKKAKADQRKAERKTKALAKKNVPNCAKVTDFFYVKKPGVQTTIGTASLPHIKSRSGVGSFNELTQEMQMLSISQSSNFVKQLSGTKSLIGQTPNPEAINSLEKSVTLTGNMQKSGKHISIEKNAFDGGKSIVTGFGDKNQGLINIPCPKTVTFQRKPAISTGKRREDGKHNSIEKYFLDEVKSTTSRSISKSQGRVIIFSSDSESDDGEGINSDIKPGTSGSHAVSSNETPSSSPLATQSKSEGFTPSENSEITFSNQINFSLGCSFLQSSHNHESVTPLRELNVNTELADDPKLLETPKRAISAVQNVLTTDSPVFMSLMDRVNARRKEN